ncbi:MAG: phosphatidylserine/phosphatidylglycerophosphate/cardiolipin synthase family protein [Gemmatimonadota bacterium]
MAPSGPLAPEVQEALGQITGREPTRDNRVRLLVDGTETYGAMLDLVQSARVDVRFENFIFRDDTVGRAFASALRDRAAGDAEVKVLYDPFGSIMSRRLPIGRRFRKSAVRVRVYNPFRPTLGFFRHGRDHRKVVVQDHERLVAGGMCLADVWSGNCIRHCTWRDSAVLVEGGAAREAAADFDLIWREARPQWGQRGTSTEAMARIDDGAGRNFGHVPVRLLSGRPGERRLEQALGRVFDAAREEILLTNAYFLPMNGLLTSLGAAARRGVKVEVLLPAHNNHPFVGLASEHIVGSLLEMGVQVWHWLGPMIHAKTAVVDRRWSVVGSSNLDALSLRKNLELDIEIHGSAIGEELSAIFARDRENCRPFTIADWRGRTFRRRAATRLAFAGRRSL